MKESRLGLGQIADFVRSLGAATEWPVVLARSAEAMPRIRPDVCCTIHVRVDDRYELVAAAGAVPPGPPGSVHGGLTGAAAAEPTPLLVPDLGVDARATAEEWLARAGLTAYFGVSIDRDGERPAVLGVASPATAPLTTDEQQFAVFIAEQAGLALRHAEILGVAEKNRRVADAFAHLPHVFDRFRQGDDSITRVHRGLGLGLAIVRDLVELHGGSVAAESRGAGEGSRFTVRLPLVTPPAALASHVASQPSSAAAAQAPMLLAGVRVLLVEDEPDAREVLQQVIDGSGAQSAVAGSADEARDAGGSFGPTTLVCDFGLPGEDGYELMRTLRRAGVAAPAIALTAYASDEARRQAFAAGYQCHLAKPVDPDDLVRAIRSLRDTQASDS